MRLAESGNQFMVISLNIQAKIQPQPAGRAETYYAGDTFRGPDPFDFLTVNNPSSTASLTLVIWVGFDARANYSPIMVPTGPIQVLKVLTAANTPTAVSAVDQYFRKGWLYAYNAFANGLPTNNGANIQVGKSKTYQPDQLAPGAVIPYEFPAGQVFNLANVFFQGAVGDGLYFDGT